MGAPRARLAAAVARSNRDKSGCGSLRLMAAAGLPGLVLLLVMVVVVIVAMVLLARAAAA